MAQDRLELEPGCRSPHTLASDIPVDTAAFVLRGSHTDGRQKHHWSQLVVETVAGSRKIGKRAHSSQRLQTFDEQTDRPVAQEE